MIANLLGLKSLAVWIKEYMYHILPSSLDWIVPQIPIEDLSEIYIVTGTMIDVVFGLGVLTAFMIWAITKLLSSSKN